MVLDLSKPSDEPKLRKGDGRPPATKASGVYVLLPFGEPSAWVLIGRVAAAIKVAHGAELRDIFVREATNAECYQDLWSIIYAWVNVELEVRPP